MAWNFKLSFPLGSEENVNCISGSSKLYLLFHLNFSQFEGFSQQDSQEFLSYLLDGIHEDLNKITKKPYIETQESEGGDDELLAKQSWENHLKRNQSMIVDLMHGQYRSQVTCPDCKRSPITFDPFLSLSLPIPSMGWVTFSLYFLYKNSDKLPLKIALTLLPDTPALGIVPEISKLLDVPAEKIVLKLIHDKSMAKADVSKYTVKSIKEFEGILFAYEIHNEEIDGKLPDYLKQERAEIEVQIYHLKGNLSSEHSSFSRYLSIPVKSTVSDLKLQSYAIMKEYLYNYFSIEEESRFFFKIDPSKFDKETLKEEYEKMVTLSEDPKKGLPYELTIRAAGATRKQRNLLPEDENTLLEQLAGGSKQLILEILIHQKLDTEFMKLNKCKAFENTNRSPKEVESYTLYECFDQFIIPEVLDKENLWYCSKCKDHKQATKKMDVYKASKILIIHLKRFKTSKVHNIGSYYFSGGSAKVSTAIDFPLEGLNLSKYILEKSDEPAIYDLEGVVNHFGGTGGGHYTAFAKNPEKNEWYEFDDSSVSRQSSNGIVSKAAYILFYRRREPGEMNGLYS